VFLNEPDTRTHKFRIGCGKRADTADWVEFVADYENFNRKFSDALIDLRLKNPAGNAYVHIFGRQWLALQNPETGQFFSLPSTYQQISPTADEIHKWLTCQIRMMEAICGMAVGLAEESS